MTVGNQAYFEALAEIESKESDEYRSTFAGLMVMRVVVDWFRMGPHAITTDITGVDKVKAAVAQISESHALRSIFEQIMDDVSRAENVSVTTVAPQLVTYGTLLVCDARWEIAAEVFRKILDETRFDKRYAELAVTAARHMASAYRHQGEWSKAIEYYTLARDIAVRSKDERNRLFAEIGMTSVMANRGDLATSESQLREILRFAEEAELQDVCATALGNLAYIMSERGDKERSMHYVQRALTLTKDARNRDRLLNNVANLSLELGQWQVAQQMFLTLITEDKETHVRACAMIDLMRIAALTKEIEDFDRYRVRLEGMALQPLVHVWFYRYLGESYAQLGRMDEAQSALERSKALAEVHQLDHARQEAEQLLAAVVNPSQRPPPSPVSNHP